MSMVIRVIQSRSSWNRRWKTVRFARRERIASSVRSKNRMIAGGGSKSGTAGSGAAGSGVPASVPVIPGAPVGGGAGRALRPTFVRTNRVKLA